jgi:hypothetical protein
MKGAPSDQRRGCRAAVWARAASGGDSRGPRTDCERSVARSARWLARSPHCGGHAVSAEAARRQGRLAWQASLIQTRQPPSAINRRMS